MPQYVELRCGWVPSTWGNEITGLLLVFWSHHWRSLELLFSRNVESFTSLHVGSFCMIPGENIILRESSAVECLPRLDNRLPCTLLDCHVGTGTMRYTYRVRIPVTA